MCSEQTPDDAAHLSPSITGGQTEPKGGQQHQSILAGHHHQQEGSGEPITGPDTTSRRNLKNHHSLKDFSLFTAILPIPSGGQRKLFWRTKRKLFPLIFPVLSILVLISAGPWWSWRHSRASQGTGSFPALYQWLSGEQGQSHPSLQHYLRDVRKSLPSLCPQQHEQLSAAGSLSNGIVSPLLGLPDCLPDEVGLEFLM